MKKEKKKIRYMPSGVLKKFVFVFAALYLGIMGAATYLVQGKFAQDHQEALQSVSEDIRWIQTQMAQEAADEGVDIGREWVGNMMDYILAVNAGTGELPYMLWSAAVWDENGNKIAESGPVYTMIPEKMNENGPLVWRLDEWLTEEEMDQLAGYDAKIGRSTDVYEQEEWTEYQESVSMDRNGEPAEIAVRRENWRKAEPDEAENWIGKVMTINNEQSYICEDSEEIWSWENPGATKGREEIGFGLLSFPAQSQGESGWKEWKRDQYLTGFPDQIRGGYSAGGEEYTEYAADSADPELAVPLLFGEADSGSGVQTCTMKFRMTSHPWMAALDYMKYVYLSGALLLLACILIVWRTLEKSYRKSAETEAYRRDFTNAMAHEMKTPLSVIRAFAENLKENPDTGKREYYLDQIVGQTEEMDDIVKEMIQVSKLDGEALTLQKEKIPLCGLLEKEVERIAPRAEERRITVGLQCAEDAEVEGDRKLLEKAFRCLLDNAVSHNREAGRILVTADREKCVIQNTGDRIPEEDLPRVFEMLWTGKRENGEGASKERHLGMGLYLAQRIFRLHGMELKVENTADGVQVSVIW